MENAFGINPNRTSKKHFKTALNGKIYFRCALMTMIYFSFTKEIGKHFSQCKSGQYFNTNWLCLSQFSL